MTDYRILSPETDISKFFGCAHGWPTVVAIRETVVVGAISTHRDDGRIICGPLKAEVPGRKVFVAFRLIEAYDKYMQELGISCYYLGLDLINTDWVAVMDKFSKRYAHVFDVDPLGESNGQAWYRRRFVSRRSWAQLMRRRAK